MSNVVDDGGVRVREGEVIRPSCGPCAAGRIAACSRAGAPVMNKQWDYDAAVERLKKAAEPM